MLTSASSFPASFLYALVHLTLRGLRFILKFLWHFDLQNLKTCSRRTASTQAFLLLSALGAQCDSCPGLKSYSLFVDSIAALVLVVRFSSRAQACIAGSLDFMSSNYCACVIPAPFITGCKCRQQSKTARG